MQTDELHLLLQAIAAKDQASFELLYYELNVPVYTILLRITQDRFLSEDLLQEFFLKLYHNPPVNTKNPRAYLFQIARNLAIDALRTTHPTIELQEDAPLQSDGSLSLTKLSLQEAFARLSLTERQFVVLHLYGGLHFREIASICQMRPGTVFWRYQKAIKQLQHDLNGV